MKLLAPAGNFECLKSAVYNGADEVYIGVNQFNARNNIDGFELKDLKSAVDFAHLFSVKVYLALNILFTDEELEQAVNVAVEAYNSGIDAVIVQDLGLIKLLSENYPQIELHASTQMGIHNLEGVKAVEPYNIKRVVLARETPLSEIKRIKDNSNVEIEYFAHGALCVCFSGNCYLSEKLLGASGNRGRCKQPCRLPFTLKKDGKKLKSGYLLSAKDFNMSKRIKDLEQVGVTSIKIEGRARRAFYVATATAEYRKAIDDLNVDQQKLALAFNRDYTEGYFNGNGNIISKSQAHRGIEVGKVYKVNNGKNFNEIFITSDRELSEKSAFKFFYNDKERAVITAYDLKEVAYKKYKMTSKNNVFVGDRVNLIVDAKEEEKLLAKVKKRNLQVNLYLEIGFPLTGEIEINGEKIKILHEDLLPAKNQPLTEKEIRENFSKNQYFNANVNVKKLEKVFLPKNKLNAFRREIFQRAFDEITKNKRQPLSKFNYVKKPLTAIHLESVQTLYQLNDIINEKHVIYSPEVYELENIKKFIARCKKEGVSGYLDLPNFALKDDILLIKNITKNVDITFIANNYYALSLGANVITGAGLNVYNTQTANALSMPFFTAEDGLKTATDYPVMTLRHCPMKAHLSANCNNCPFEDGYTYITDDGRELKLKRKKLSTCTFYLEKQ